MRGTDHWRLVGILPPELRGREDVTLDDVIRSVRREAGEDLAVQGCSWFSSYRIHHRRAERFRAGRCFLLGDAAHIHSPVGAQGMNTGLQDAYNLGWKLALVASGRAREALLDTYEGERVPVAQRLLSSTDRGFSFVVSDSRLVGLLRTRAVPRILALAMSLASLRKAAFRTISQIGIHYRESPLSRTADGLPGSAPRGGDRFPWLRLRLVPDGPVEDLYGKIDDTRFTLLLFGQPAPGGEAAWPGGLLRKLVVAGGDANDAELARAGIPRSAFYLLRPDGYVGLCGARFDAGALARYASDRLGLKTA
jgi:hypothetical protein